MHFHLAEAPRAHTHDTKLFPGYGEACLNPNSLPQPPTCPEFTCNVFVFMGTTSGLSMVVQVEKCKPHDSKMKLQESRNIVQPTNQHPTNQPANQPANKTAANKQIKQQASHRLTSNQLAKPRNQPSNRPATRGGRRQGRSLKIIY